MSLHDPEIFGITESSITIAYGVDDRGRRIYTIEVMDLGSGKVLDRIPGVTSNVVWSEHPDYLFYTKRDL